MSALGRALMPTSLGGTVLYGIGTEFDRLVSQARQAIWGLRIMAGTRTEVAATIDDLYRVDGKAELIGGRIVPLMPTGRRPNRIAFRIVRSLDDHAEAPHQGEAYTDNMGFTVPKLSSGRESFSPDASYYLGPFPSNAMRFIKGPPTFAVEVRSENDYGEAADEKRASKRADSFEAGTLVVWDVDPEAELIYCYRREDPDVPVVFGAGQDADAEPAVHDWRMPVNRIFA
jgi:Uma2 family endonuclease